MTAYQVAHLSGIVWLGMSVILLPAGILALIRLRPELRPTGIARPAIDAVLVVLVGWLLFDLGQAALTWIDPPGHRAYMAALQGVATAPLALLAAMLVVAPWIKRWHWRVLETMVGLMMLGSVGLALYVLWTAW
jgi:hypothetical protein